MIADPKSAATTSSADPSTTLDDGPLSQTELYQLTLYKWRYSLEAYGFTPQEVRELMFLKWLHASRRLAS
ncbi:MAG: hypothetical protein M3336_16375 [Chloroflexota bacterium]|nr:hypothetical protein [Chloroflexota bacterium]